MFLTLLSLVTMSAMADGKVYPAIFCRPSSASTTTYTVNSQGRMYNSSTSSSLTVYCPIIDDEYGSGGRSDNDVSATVAVVDNSSSSSVSCYLLSRPIESTTSVATSSDSSEGSDTDVQYLELSATTYSGWGDEFEYLKCTIPAKDSTGGYSYLISYETDEASD